jgi:hypothetical protein
MHRVHRSTCDRPHSLRRFTSPIICTMPISNDAFANKRSLLSKECGASLCSYRESSWRGYYAIVMADRLAEDFVPELIDSANEDRCTS